MKILQFAFSGTDDNPYLPQHIEPNSVVYTGTHDNDTTLGWYHSMAEHQREHVDAYLYATHAERYMPSMPEDLVDMALATQANLAIIPMQDILRLGGEHRMNTPGTSSGNWHWRFNWLQLTTEQKMHISAAIVRTGR
jgi:4-alpha-glucanotransferase